MKLRSLSDRELLSRTHELARREQDLTLEVLTHLEEVNRRRLYAAQGHSSLFSYVVKALGYSEPAAAQRISAMHLARDVPQARAAMEQGRLSLTTAAMVQQFVRREERQAGKRMDEARKADLVEQCAGQSTREVDRRLAIQASTPATIRPDTARPIGEQWTELRFLAGLELMGQIQRVREIRGADHPLAEVFQWALGVALEREDPVRKAERAVSRAARRSAPTEQTVRAGCDPAVLPASPVAAAPAELRRDASQAPESVPAVAPPAVAPPDAALPPAPAELRRDASQALAPQLVPFESPTRYVPAKVRHAVLLRAQARCEWVDPTTGRRCDATHRLELDHLMPFARGGQHSVLNTRMTCSGHNARAAVESFGLEKMSLYFR